MGLNFICVCSCNIPQRLSSESIFLIVTEVGNLVWKGWEAERPQQPLSALPGCQMPRYYLSQYCQHNIKARITLVLYFKPLLSHWLFQEPSWQHPPASYPGQPSPRNSWARPHRPVQKGQTTSGQRNRKYGFRLSPSSCPQYFDLLHVWFGACLRSFDCCWSSRSCPILTSWPTDWHTRNSKFNQWYPNKHNALREALTQTDEFCKIVPNAPLIFWQIYCRFLGTRKN